MLKRLINLRKNKDLKDLGKTLGIASIVLESSQFATGVFSKASKLVLDNEVELTKRRLKMNPYAQHSDDVFTSGKGLHWVKISGLLFAAEIDAEIGTNFVTERITFYCLTWQLEKLKTILTGLYDENISLPVIYTQDEHAPMGNYHEIGRIKPFYGTRPQFIDKEQYAQIDKLFKRVLHDKKWYLDAHKAHKECLLFTGPPGTGKSTLARHLASKYNMDMYILTPKQLRPSIVVGDGEKPALLLIEDIDAYLFLTQRDSARESDIDEPSRYRNNPSEAVYNNFINYLDGILPLDNLVIIMTTNYPEKLKPSIIRKGRVDYSFHLDHPEIDTVVEALCLSPNEAKANWLRSNYAKGDVTVGMISELRLAKDITDMKEIISEAQKLVIEPPEAA